MEVNIPKSNKLPKGMINVSVSELTKPLFAFVVAAGDDMFALSCGDEHSNQDEAVLLSVPLDLEFAEYQYNEMVKYVAVNCGLNFLSVDDGFMVALFTNVSAAIKEFNGKVEPVKCDWF